MSVYQSYVNLLNFSLYSRKQKNNRHGSENMGNELSMAIVASVAAILLSATTYALGYKEGNREGYTRGRSVSRHVAAANKAVK